MLKNKKIKKVYETIIIGAGIGGISAGIYASRKRMNYLIIAKDIGGQIYESGEILNYPGIIKTTGVELAERILEQIKFNKIKINQEEVKSIKKLNNKNWEIKTGLKEYETQTVIIATGSKPRKLNVKGEKEFAKKGLTYCAICDGPLFRNKNIAIIGGGNSALEAANFMINISKKIYLITKNSEMTGFPYLKENILNKKNIEIVSNASIKEILGKQFVTGVKYTKENKEKKIKVRGVIVEIGRVQDNSFVKGIIDLDEHRHIKVDRWARCFIKGKPNNTIYAIGDCSDIHEYQCIISAGIGALALLKCVRYLAKQKRR